MEFYNDPIKQSYLETIENEGSRTTISYIFEASLSAEKNVLGKDLYNFSRDEIAEVLKNMSPKSINSARTNMFNIRTYINWSIKKGYRDNNLNPLDGVDKNWYTQFIDRTTKIHWSEEEITDFVEELPNAQDQAFIRLIFEGIMGKSFSELQQLHYNHINWNENKIFIPNRNITLEVSEKCMRYLTNAYKQQTYYTFHKDAGEHNERELIKSDFIFKNVKSQRTVEGNPVSQQVFYTRLINMREEFGVEYLTPNSIKQSGMLYMAFELYKEYGKLEYEQFAMIGDRFGASKISSNGYEYYNTTIMKEYINYEKIKELYDLDIEI